MIGFEFDEAKSAANLAKHGIDFRAAQSLWTDRAVERPLAYPQETRLLRIGMLDGKLWSAVFTMRNGRIRLISVRRSRKQEVEEYGQTE